MWSYIYSTIDDESYNRIQNYPGYPGCNQIDGQRALPYDRYDLDDILKKGTAQLIYTLQV